MPVSPTSRLLRRRAAAAIALSMAASLLITACGSSASSTVPTSAPSPAPSSVPSSFAPTTVTLVTHDSFALTEALVTEFAARSGITIKIIAGGDAGEVVNRAALTAGNPEGDVLFGVDNTLLSRAVTAGVFDPYVSPAAADVAPELRASTFDTVTPIDYGDVCVNVDDRWYADKGVTPPMTLADLALPAYRDQLVVENAATSSPGLAFLLATIARYGESGYEDYWRSLRANGVKVVNGWTEAYEGEFSAGGKGSRPLVVSYASSPPAELVYAADPKPTKPSTSVLTDGCFRQVEYAGVLRGTTKPDAARAVVDWLLSPQVQADVPLAMFVFPARTGTPLPEVFDKFAARPAKPLTLEPAAIDQGRSAWVEAWDRVTLR